MAFTTNVPPITFGANGVQIPSQQAVLAGVVADFKAAFGSALNLDASDTATLSTPQGQLASSIAAIVYNVYQTFLYQSTQTDPAYAQGRWLDAICRIYFEERNPSEPTVVGGLCTGLPGTIIPTGSLTTDDNGNLFSCTDGGTIPAGGSVTLQFACMLPGPTTVPANTMTTIYKAIPGWDSVNNPSDGVLGTDVESNAALRERRAESVAKNSVGTLPAILGAVLAVPNVLDAYVTENVLPTPATVGGFTLAPNSLYVAAVGGDSQAVAHAIWSKKAPGCDYNGNTTVTVTDDSSGYSPPLPTYQVSFETPEALPILFQVRLANNGLVPADAVTQVQNAVIQAFAGADGGARARIGSTIYASRFYAPVASLGAWVQIIQLEVGSTDDSDAVVFAGSVAGTALSVTETISGSLAIGQTVVDFAGLIAAGTTIASGSGSSWVLSASATVPRASFTGSGSGTNLTASGVTGTILAGMYVTGTGCPTGTKIVSQTSGTTGGAGVYVTSGATTASTSSLVAAPALGAATPDQNSVAVQIDQVPTITAANIAVVLV